MLIRPTWWRSAALPIAPLAATLLAMLSGCAPPAEPPVALVPPSSATNAPAPPAPGPPIAPANHPIALRPASTPSCRLDASATLPLLFPGGRPMVQIAANGRMLHLQLDTGAETSVLTQSGAQAIGLAPGPTRIQVAGLGGAAGYGAVTVGSIQIGGQTLRGLTLPVMPLDGAPDLDGLLGADLLAPYEVELDPAARSFTLYRAYGCTHPAPPWRAAAMRFRRPGALPVIGAWLDGRPIDALLDTGSNVSAVDSTHAAVPSAELNAARATHAIGAGGQPIEGRTHRFARLQLGDIAFDQPTLRVQPLAPTLGIGLVIGMDLLAGRRLWLDYAGRRAFLGAPSR